MHESVREAFNKCIEAKNAAEAEYNKAWGYLDGLLNQRDTSEWKSSKEFRDELEKKILEARVPAAQSHMAHEEMEQDYRTLVKYFGEPV